MEILKLWTFLSGKKTALAAIAYAISDILTAIGQPDIADVVKQVAYTLTGIGLGHKTVKAVK